MSADTATGSNPWEQLSEEGAKAHAAFRVYLELGARRTISATARGVGKSQSLLWRWASKYNWEIRARAWDREVARQREVDLRKHRRELLERRLRRAKETDTVGRLLVNQALPREAHSGEVKDLDKTALRHGERFLRLATEIEDRCLADAGSESHENTLEEELWSSDDDALRRIIAQAKGTTADHAPGDGSAS